MPDRGPQGVPQLRLEEFPAVKSLPEQPAQRLGLDPIPDQVGYRRPSAGPKQHGWVGPEGSHLALIYCRQKVQIRQVRLSRRKSMMSSRRLSRPRTIIADFEAAVCSN